MASLSTASTKLLLAAVAIAFAVLAYQAAMRPIRPGEAYLYDRFVRPTASQVWAAELPNPAPLYTLLEKRSIGLFHVSPFSVRLPSLLFGILFLWSAYQFGGSWLFPVAAVAIFFGGFDTADGVAGAAALQLFAAQSALKYLRNQRDNIGMLNLCGVGLGLSVAACMTFWPSAVATSLIVLVFLVRKRGWSIWTDRVLIPGAVASFVLLVLPLSHAEAPTDAMPTRSGAESEHLQTALAALASSASTVRASIGASVDVQPVVNFYRAQHRINSWDLADQRLGSKEFDYYVLSKRDVALIGERGLVVLFRNGQFAVARRPD